MQGLTRGMRGATEKLAEEWISWACRAHDRCERCWLHRK